MFWQSRIGWKTLAGLSRRIGTSLAAGLDVRGIWQTEAGRGSLAHRARMTQIGRAISQGESLTDAMRRAGNYFPAVVFDLVAVGERTGRLEEVFSHLAEHYEHLTRMRRQFLLGILWPAIQLGAAVAIVGLLIGISGWISRMAGQPIDFLGFGLVGTRGVVVYLLLVAGAVGVGWVALRAVRRGWLGTGPVMRVAMRMPIVGSCLNSAAMGRMAWGLSMAVKSGLDARQSARIAIQSTQNVFFTRRLDVVDREIAAGREIHEALRAASVFPIELVHAVQVGEKSGKLDETMDRLAKQYQDQAHASSNGITLVATFVIWALVASVLIALIIRLAITYRDMIMGAAR